MVERFAQSLGLRALSDVVYREKNVRESTPQGMDAAAGEDHRPLAPPENLAADDEVLKVQTLDQCTPQRLAEFGDVPVSVLQLEEALTQRLGGAGVEHAVERRAGRHHAEIRVENQQRLPYRVDDGQRVVSSASEFGLPNVESGVDFSELFVLGRQYLIELGKLVVGGVEFLVERPEFLVGGLHLLRSCL